jgi:hypothetical protein
MRPRSFGSALVAAAVALSGCTSGSDAPPVTRGAVEGTVLDAHGDPLFGVTVSANGGTPVTSGADGGFAIEGVTVPYQLAAVWAVSGDHVAVVLDGLTRTDPVVRMPPRASPSPPSSSATLEGVLAGPPRPYPENVHLAAAAPRAEWVDLSSYETGEYDGYVEWSGTQALSSVLHVMHVDDSDAPTEYWYGTRPLALLPGDAIAGQDVTLSRLGTGTLSVAVASPTGPGLDCGAWGGCSRYLVRRAELAGGASLSLGNQIWITDPSPLVFVTPDLAPVGGSLVLGSWAGGPGGTSDGWWTGVPATATLDATPRDAAALVAPADAATGVGPGTAFSWDAPAFADGVHELRVVHGSIGSRSLWAYTAATSFVLPDLEPLGFPLPSGPGYSWLVVSSGPATLDGLVARSGAPTPSAWYTAQSGLRSFAR